MKEYVSGGENTEMWNSKQPRTHATTNKKQHHPTYPVGHCGGVAGVRHLDGERDNVAGIVGGGSANAREDDILKQRLNNGKCFLRDVIAESVACGWKVNASINIQRRQPVKTDV